MNPTQSMPNYDLQGVSANSSSGEELPLYSLQISQLQKHLSKDVILYKMLPYLQNREFALLEPKGFQHVPHRDVRVLRAHNIQSIHYIFEGMLRAFERGTVYNMYYSTATFEKGVPYTHKLSERDLSDWKINFYAQIKTVDFFLDIDAPTHQLEDIEIAKKDVIRIIEDFDKDAEYEIRFTGCGFHIVIPQIEMMFRYRVQAVNCNPFEKDNIWEEYTKIAQQFSDKYSELIDCNLNDSRRIIKLPYSLAFYPEQTYICSPLTLQELKDFKLENYTYEAYNE